MESVKVFLTTAQKNKMQGGKPFQLSATQLQAGSGKHHVEIQMTAKNHKAVAEKALDKIGEKTGQSEITNALKGSVDGLVDVGANKISGGKLVKGSQAMKDHMARIREMRKGKGMDMNMEMEGGNIFDDIRNGFNRTFIPKLGREIKSAFESKPAREIYKGLSRAGLQVGSAFTGLPLGVAQGENDRAIDGAGVGKRRYRKKNMIVQGGTLVGGVPSEMRMENHPMIRHGGVMKKVGKGFTSSKGTHYGGSFMSPTSGGSFTSP
jgi:hypothetical protein